ncbi:MAG: hypothetical protein ACOYJG_03275 [Prevotella sp.]|jgi:hypothetical protein
MKKLIIVALIFPLIGLFVSCNNSKKPAESQNTDTALVTGDTITDSTVYGKVVDGGQSVLLLQTDAGDTIEYILENEFGEPVTIQGGYNLGDRLAVVGYKINDENIVRKAINLLSLQGHWTSLDKNFTIEEGGVVHSSVEAEKNPWTTWKILNGKLMLNRQAFDVVTLGADSLALEDSTGIYLFKRQR